VLVVALGALFAALVAVAPAAAAPGDVYLVNEDTPGPPGSGAVLRFGPGGGAATVVARSPTFADPTGMTLMRDGRLAVVDSGFGSESLYIVTPATGAVSRVAQAPLDFPTGVDEAPDGTLLIVSEDSDQVFRYTPATNAVTLFATLPVSSLGRGIVATRDGGAFVTSDESSTSLDRIYRVSPTGAVSTFVQDVRLERPRGFAITPDEKTLLVAADTTNFVLSVDVASKAIATRVSTISSPQGVTIAPDNSLLVSDRGNSELWRVGLGAPIGTVFSNDDLIAWPKDAVIEPAPCAGKVPTLVGTTGPDVLQGSEFADVIDTLGGNDVVDGLGGNDVICGGTERDVLRGGSGADTLMGQAGRDKLVGGKGKDRLLGGTGKDKLIGGKGKDRLRGGKGSDTEKQ
jgi:DNA-binding beta-propeller fold protein YncE